MTPRILRGGRGEVVLPWDEAYGEARREWNRRIDKFPRAIVYCEDRQDVSRSIEWARRCGAPLRIRGGGHHYEGYSTGNGAIVADLSRMSGVAIEDGLVRAQGGASNAALYGAVGPAGYAFPGGTCPTVCLSGLAQGGGWGLSCRLLGLACDSLESAELVDGCGRALTASPRCNQELFWALRGGGGGNFGVVTGLAFRLPDLQPEAVTLINLYHPGAVAQAQALFWETWQRWLEGADERVTLQAALYHTPEEGFSAYSRGIFYGPEDEAQEAVAPLAELPDIQASFTPMTFFEATQAIGKGYPPYEKFKSTGRFVTHPFTPEQIAHMVDTLRSHPEGSVYTAYSLYALGGAVSRHKPADTAFFYRDARYIALLQSVWEEDAAEAAGIAWVEQNFPYLASLTAGSCVNFPYSSLRNPMQAYYGGNANRLRRVKRLYDPYNVFCFQQSIR